MKRELFIKEVKNHIKGEDENGNLLIDFTALNKALNPNGFGKIEKALFGAIVEKDKEYIAKFAKSSVEQVEFLYQVGTGLRAYSVNNMVYTIDRCNTIESVA